MRSRGRVNVRASRFQMTFMASRKKLLGRLSAKHEKIPTRAVGFELSRKCACKLPLHGARPNLYPFWLIREESKPDFERKSWVNLLSLWLNLVPVRDRCRAILGQDDSGGYGCPAVRRQRFLRS